MKRELKKVREYLYDFYEMTEGNTIRQILADIFECEVDSEKEAKNLVNQRITTYISWLNTFRFK